MGRIPQLVMLAKFATTNLTEERSGRTMHTDKPLLLTISNPVPSQNSPIYFGHSCWFMWVLGLPLADWTFEKHLLKGTGHVPSWYATMLVVALGLEDDAVRAMEGISHHASMKSSSWYQQRAQGFLQECNRQLTKLIVFSGPSPTNSDDANSCFSFSSVEGVWP